MKHSDTTNAAIGARIRELRQKMKMTQEDFAEKAGICSAQQVSNIERGVRGLSLTKFIDVCKTLEIEADYLLFGVSTNNVETQLSKYLKQMTNEQTHYALEFIKLYADASGIKLNQDALRD